MTVFERRHMPSLGGATAWLNSEPLDRRRVAGPGRPRELLDVDVHQLAAPGAVRPRVVAGLPGRRAWSVIGVHTPEFSFEHDVDGVRLATEERAIDYPVAVDNEYAIWSAFANRYWPALYFVDADGVIRDEHFGEGRYEQSERVIQRLLGVERELVSVEGLGVEAAGRLGSPANARDVSGSCSRRAARGPPRAPDAQPLGARR